MLAHLTANDVEIGEIGAVLEAGFVPPANLECLDTTLFTCSSCGPGFNSAVKITLPKFSHTCIVSGLRCMN
jgi:hypothetical protein